MTPELAIWLLVIFVQTALLGITMYTLICLADLENDFINPHDASERINRCVIPELFLMVALGMLYIGSRNFLLMALPLCLCAWILRENCAAEKKRRLIKLAAHVVLFVLSIFKLVTTIVNTLLSGEGLRVTKLLKILLGF